MNQNFSTHTKTLKLASWLGWKMESNWADWWIFAVYSVVRPLASSMILVVMYWVIAKSGHAQATGSYNLTFMYLGNAFFMFVGNVLYGVAWTIHEDREHYQMLKYIFISPAMMYFYLFGRGTAKLFITLFAVIATIAFGMLVLKIPIDLATVNYPMLVLVTGIGLLGIAALGVILAAVSMVTAHHSFYLTEGVAGLFFLVSGAIFPIEVLPGWLQKISLINPLTYWIELARRYITGERMCQVLSGISNLELFFILTLSTLILVYLSVIIYRFFEHLAVQRGLIDRLTNF